MAEGGFLLPELLSALTVDLQRHSRSVEDAQETLTEMQMSAEEFSRQAGSLSARYSSICKELTEITKTALNTVTKETNQRLSNMTQAAKKKICLCAWISITAVILCAALCALAVLWSR